MTTTRAPTDDPEYIDGLRAAFAADEPYWQVRARLAERLADRMHAEKEQMRKDVIEMRRRMVAAQDESRLLRAEVEHLKAKATR